MGDRSYYFFRTSLSGGNTLLPCPLRRVDRRTVTQHVASLKCRNISIINVVLYLPIFKTKKGHALRDRWKKVTLGSSYQLFGRKSLLFSISLVFQFFHLFFQRTDDRFLKRFNQVVRIVISLDFKNPIMFHQFLKKGVFFD